jgi:hypothetical protein
VFWFPLFALAQSGDPPSGLQSVMWNQEQALGKAEQQKDSDYFKKTLDDKLIYVAYNGLVFTKDKLV